MPYHYLAKYVIRILLLLILLLLIIIIIIIIISSIYIISLVIIINVGPRIDRRDLEWGPWGCKERSKPCLQRYVE